MALARRFWPAAALASCAALFAWRVRDLVREAEEGWSWVVTSGPLLLLAVAAAGLGVVVLIVRRFWDRAHGVAGWRAGAATVTVALLATMPVSFGYDDGCNDHGTVAPLALVPVLAVDRPARAVGAYSDWSTLMACFDGPAAPLP